MTENLPKTIYVSKNYPIPVHDKWIASSCASAIWPIK